MSPPSDRERVEHILDAIRKVETRIAAHDESAFAADDLVHDSVLYQLALIGEAARRLSDAVRLRNPQIPWAQVVGFRNRVMHGYHSVSLRIVWQTIQQDLPALRSAMERELVRQAE